MMFVAPQTALSTSTRRLTVYTVHAMTIHPRNIIDASSYETLCEADSSSDDVVIYWIITDTHIVPDRQQYDQHTHQVHMIPGGTLCEVDSSSGDVVIYWIMTDTHAVSDRQQ